MVSRSRSSSPRLVSQAESKLFPNRWLSRYAFISHGRFEYALTLYSQLAWTALFPEPNNFPPATLPAAWTNALNASIAAGKIPNIPLSTLGAKAAPSSSALMLTLIKVDRLVLSILPLTVLPTQRFVLGLSVAEHQAIFGTPLTAR